MWKLNTSCDALGHEPSGLQVRDYLGNLISLALVEDLILGNAGDVHVFALHEVLDLSCGHRERWSIRRFEYEASAVGVEAVDHGPLPVSSCLHLYSRSPRRGPLAAREEQQDLWSQRTDEEPANLAEESTPEPFAMGGNVEVKHDP